MKQASRVERETPAESQDSGVARALAELTRRIAESVNAPRKERVAVAWPEGGYVMELRTLRS